MSKDNVSHLQENSKEVWRQNYKAPKEKTVKDTWDRQAKAASSVEKESIREDVYKDFLWLLDGFNGMAGGRITANLGVEGREGTTLMNCFVHNPRDIGYKDPDSIAGIYDFLKSQALTLQSEGGYGMNFSWIRPQGMFVAGIGSRTPGVVKFMELWDKSSEIITMGSKEILGPKRDDEKNKIRKGAQMGILEPWHPDIFSFIDAKQTEGRLSKFNISVGITEGFMDAVIKDKMWALKYPDTTIPEYKTEWYGNIHDWEKKGYAINVYNKVKATDLFEKIMVATYNRNDPGILFLDIANKYNPLSYCEDIATTNPCIAGETLVAVADDRFHVSIKELADIGLDVPVYCLDNDGNIVVRLMRQPRCTGTKRVFNVGFENGEILRVTDNHKFKNSNNEYVEVKDLSIGTEIKTMVNISSIDVFKVTSIESDKIEDVYNGTVDEFHNYFVGGKLSEIDGVYFNNKNCGEIAMSTGVCNLLSINLTRYITTDENGVSKFDFEKFKKAVSIGVRFSDNINDISRAPLQEYKESMVDKRRIGLGVLGLGSLHFMLGIRFASTESLKLIDDIFRTKAETEILASAKLGKEKGSFKFFDNKKYFDTLWWKSLPISEDVKNEVEKIGEMRNSHRSANAPTGNMSIYAGNLSGGIEPIFMKEYVRWSIVPEQERAKLKDKGFKFPEVHEGQWFETDILKQSKSGTDNILKGTFDGIDFLIDKNRGLCRSDLIQDYGWKFVNENFSKEKIQELENNKVFTTTTELSVDEHISTLEIIAKYTDMNSSKTINIPSNYSYEDFKTVYINAWKAGIKGITTYREGTMTAVLEKKQEVQEKKEELEQSFVDAGDEIVLEQTKLPEEYYSKGFRIKDNNHKKWYVNIAFADKAMARPFAIFVNTNNKETNEVTDDTIHALIKLARKKGLKKTIIDAHEEKLHGQTNVVKIARCIGLLLRHNVKLIDIVDILMAGDYPFSSFTFHITRLLKKFIKDGTVMKGKGSECPECKGEMVFESGCVLCRSCAYSKCG